MAGAHEEKEPAAAGGRSRPGEVRKSAVVHAAARRYVDVQERALPQTLRDYRRAERRVSGLGCRRPSVSVVRLNHVALGTAADRRDSPRFFQSERGGRFSQFLHPTFFTRDFPRSILYSEFSARMYILHPAEMKEIRPLLASR